MYEWLREHPGAHVGKMVRDLRLGWGNAQHHLGVLERTGLVVEEHEGNRNRLFIAGQMDREDRHLFALLQNDSLRQVLDVVDAHPGIIQREIADRLGVTATAVRKQLKRLEAEGLVTSERDGRTTHYTAHLPHPGDDRAPQAARGETEATREAAAEGDRQEGASAQRPDDRHDAYDAHGYRGDDEADAPPM